MQDSTLGIKIKEIRTKRRMTLKVLAEMTGFSISFLSQLERGKSSATLESLKKISIALKSIQVTFSSTQMKKKK